MISRLQEMRERKGQKKIPEEILAGKFPDFVKKVNL